MSEIFARTIAGTDYVLRTDTSQTEMFVRRMCALFPLGQEAAYLDGLVDHVTVTMGSHPIKQDLHHNAGPLVLLDGLACHFQTVDSDRRQMTGFVLPGDFFDYGFLSGSPVRQGLASLGRAVVGRLNLERLSALADSHPNVVVAAMRGASIELACSRQMIVNLGARDAITRMAHFLCEMHQRMDAVGLVSERGQFALGMTQAEIGEALGLSTVHVNRTVQQLRKQTMIVIGQGSVTVPNWRALCDLAAFDGRYLRAA